MNAFAIKISILDRVCNILFKLGELFADSRNIDLELCGGAVADWLLATQKSVLAVFF